MTNSAPQNPPGPGRIEPLGHVESMRVIVPLLESLLDDDIDEVSLPMRTQLALMMQWPGLVQAVCVQTAFGRRAGEQNLERAQRLLSQGGRGGVSFDERALDLTCAGAASSDELTRLFRGESGRRPPEQRLLRGIVLMQATGDAAPPELRQPMLCAIAWLLWAHGERDDAMTALVRASQIDATEPLTRRLIVLVSQATPQWLRL